MKIKGLLPMTCIMGGILLSACGTGNEEVTDTSIPETFYSGTVMQTELRETVISEEKPVQTASSEDVQWLIDSAELPEIIIDENSSAEDILLAGERAGVYFGRAAEEFFGYGIEYSWKIDNQDRITLDGIDGIAPYLVNSGYRKSAGYFTDRENDIYAPMDYEEAKQFIMSRIGLTERGFDELCRNSPSNYLGIDGELYISSGDGGQAGWSYSRIVGYETGENTVAYNCERVGEAGDWGYDEDIIMPFTFRLAREDDVWKLDSVSYGEGFFELKWLNSNSLMSETDE